MQSTGISGDARALWLPRVLVLVTHQVVGLYHIKVTL